MSENIMTHFVAGYPDLETSRSIAEAMIEAGAGALEIQFPFSDPMADGPVIQEACQVSLEGGFTLQQGFDLVKDLSSRYDLPIYIMSYGGPVYNLGVREYTSRAKDTGAKGLIIPDLCMGQDEGLYAEGQAQGMEIVPVMISSMDSARMEEILGLNPAWVYMVLRRGITGSYTDLGEEQLSLLKDLQNRGIQVYGGFGIQKREQVEMLAPITAGQIVGSQLVRAIQAALKEGSAPANSVAKLLMELRGQ